MEGSSFDSLIDSTRVTAYQIGKNPRSWVITVQDSEYQGPKNRGISSANSISFLEPCSLEVQISFMENFPIFLHDNKGIDKYQEIGLITADFSYCNGFVRTTGRYSVKPKNSDVYLQFESGGPSLFSDVLLPLKMTANSTYFQFFVPY